MPLCEESFNDAVSISFFEAAPQKAFEVCARERRHFEGFEERNIIEAYLAGAHAKALMKVF